MGFYARFLESNQKGVAEDIYRLWLSIVLIQLIVSFDWEIGPSRQNRNQSTTDGTKVVGRAEKSLDFKTIPPGLQEPHRTAANTRRYDTETGGKRRMLQRKLSAYFCNHPRLR